MINQINEIKGNKGEWSELYVLLRLLADGKIHGADESLNKLEEVFFPILKIIRNKGTEQKTEYVPGEQVEIYVNDQLVHSVSRNEFEQESERLLREIKSGSGGAFAIQSAQNFMEKICCKQISAPSRDKSDITMMIHDSQTGYRPTVGFSIKSNLGSSPTLLNAGRATNFLYKIVSNNYHLLEQANAIYRLGTEKGIDVRKRINKISQEGKIEFLKTGTDIFSANLLLIDSRMEEIIAHTLLYYYRDGLSSCEDIVKRLEEEDPLHFNNAYAYRYKFKKFLAAIALGMKPGTVWEGIDEASGGYIIVKDDGEVLAYHLYNRNYFEDYLLKNTKYDTPSTTRHGFGEVYEEDVDGKTLSLIKLNLQIRFK
ncbi:restriction endonuclease HpaII [Oligella urethralis DNF00040]|uniref:Restriction endonuclease HpaII n=2 Tax=Alcaligenaceae TaxID=506 RepID=A0A096BEU3_9BURK|nr:HpaII family restriction endonuclease [Oligella urethralis]KGF31679.1 restriction endonuclease HpaII [Oligella urethralis DNF00040]OFV46092.1 restriction endonuclease [Oligella sp. HMSC09E12]PMC19210.1 HpaII family restriction endonuclease [Oligella urethralis]SUA64699.1 HpaII restriction endonuclease [Oligella urethralis]